MPRFKLLNIILGLFFSFLLTTSFFLLAVPDLNQKIIEIKQMYSVNSSFFTKMINFPQAGDYVIKVKYNFANTDGEVVVLNGDKLELRINKEKGIIRTRYYYAPREVVKEGKNFLRINFYPSNPPDIDLRIRNYLTSAAGGNVVLTLKNSVIRKKDFVSVVISGIIFFIFSLGLWVFTTYLGNIFNLSMPAVIYSNVIAFSPAMLLYLISGVGSAIGPFSLAVSPVYLFIFLFITILIFSIGLDLLFLFLFRKINSEAISKQGSLDKAGIVKSYELPFWLEKILNWIKSREFSDKCILFFMFLLIMCAFLLILHLEPVAEQLANVAYLALVLGVTIKFVRFIKEERRKSNEKS